jgi:hypothetical protein
MHRKPGGSRSWSELHGKVKILDLTRILTPIPRSSSYTEWASSHIFLKSSFTDNWCKGATRNNGKFCFRLRAMCKGLCKRMSGSKIRSSFSLLSRPKWILTLRLRLLGFYWQHPECLDSSCCLQITIDFSFSWPDRQSTVLYGSQISGLVKCGWNYPLSTSLQSLTLTLKWHPLA